MTIPITDSDVVKGSVRSSSGRWRRVLGVLFVAAGLALVFWLTMRVTNWGRQELQAPPVSHIFTESAAV